MSDITNARNVIETLRAELELANADKLGYIAALDAVVSHLHDVELHSGHIVGPSVDCPKCQTWRKAAK